MQHVASIQSLAFALGVGSLINLICTRLRIPAILPLLLAGLALGRSGIHVVGTYNLGDALEAFITVAIAVLVFEGGLHLGANELRRAPRAVLGLLSIGAVCTWVLTALSARFVLGVSWPASWLLGAILIVTGPTVVQPLIRRFRLNRSLSTVLGAEAVLVDPICVLAVVTTLDLVAAWATRPGTGQGWLALTIAGPPLMAGLLSGIGVGLGSRWLLQFLAARERLDTRQLNLFAMGTCMTSVGLGEWIAPQAGLLAATLCAIITANITVIGAKDVRQFKEQIASILVGALFILLGSRFELHRLDSVTTRDLVFVAVMILAVRPATVLVATARSELSWRERAYAAFFAPRGVVAASVVSIAASRLTALAAEAAGGESSFDPGRITMLAAEARHFEITMFLLIVVTVVQVSLLGLPLAALLRVRAAAPNGVLIVGGHPAGLMLARILSRHGITTCIVDSNETNISACRGSGLRAVCGDATDLRWLEEQVSGSEFGWAICWTGNTTVDRVVERWANNQFGYGHAACWDDIARSEKPPQAGIHRDIRDLVESISAGGAVVAQWEGADTEGIPVLFIDQGRVTLPLTAGPRSAQQGRLCVGIRPRFKLAT
ncbi:MAG: hypothetical protein AMXMBFR58_15700 [Phycisphaerae bacterium]|nr:K(+)/H(+) antiporter NhaP2 [Phycisphaerales bacterium]